MLVAQGRQMERSGFLETTAAQRIDQVWASVEVLPQRVNVPGLRRADDALDHFHLALGAGASALGIAREQLDRFVTPFLGDLIDRTTIAVGRCGVEARSESTLDCLDVTGAGGFEHAVALAER